MFVTSRDAAALLIAAATAGLALGGPAPARAQTETPAPKAGDAKPAEAKPAEGDKKEEAAKPKEDENVLKEFDGDTVVATVGEREITLRDLIEARRRLPPQAQRATPDVLFEGLLEQTVTREIFAQEGEAAKLGDDAEIKRQVESFRRELIGRTFVTNLLAKAAQDVTDDELKKRYDEEIGKLPKVEEVRARHILVKTEEEAKAIKAEAEKEGADFAKLAETKSTGPSKTRGGDLGFFTKERMVPEFSKAAFALKAGEISEPVKTAFGWHVIKLEERRTQAPPPFERVAGQIRRGIAREKAQAMLEELRKERVTTPEKRPPFSAIRDDKLAE